MRYVTAQEMRAIDRAAIEKRGIPAATLMERAGEAVAREVIRLAGSDLVSIVCGYGNNGGDGFVVARLLSEAGYETRVFTAGRARPFTPETQGNADKAAALGIALEPVNDEAGLGYLASSLKGSSVIVDALFGIGLRGPLDESARRVIEAINAARKPVIAVDTPSGLDADTGMPLPVAVKATKTVTMGYPKAGFRAPGAAAYLGELIIADIGL